MKVVPHGEYVMDARELGNNVFELATLAHEGRCKTAATVDWHVICLGTLPAAEVACFELYQQFVGSEELQAHWDDRVEEAWLLVEGSNTQDNESQEDRAGGQCVPLLDMTNVPRYMDSDKKDGVDNGVKVG